jgi:hypothetical protein
VLISYRTEGTMWHGYPLLEDAKVSVDRWNTCEDGASRYDKKLAGSHFVVYYPLGKSMSGGALKDNYDIAQEILNSLESSGMIAMPSTLLSFVEGMENNAENQAWKLEFLDSTGAKQSSFVDRLKYLDTCKTRAMHIPERAIMEGQFGTKAEAEGHQDIMTVLLQNLDSMVTEEINYQVVDHLLELNFGKELVGQVWLESPPISDDKINAMRALFTSMLGNQNGFMEIFPYIDFSAMMDLTEVPKNKDVVKPAPEQQAGGFPSALMAGKEQRMPGVDPQALMAQKMGLTPGVPAPLSRLLQAMSKGKDGSGNFPQKPSGPVPPQLKPFQAKPKPSFSS